MYPSKIHQPNVGSMLVHRLRHWPNMFRYWVDVLTQCRINVGPPSTTLAQHVPILGWCINPMSDQCWSTVYDARPTILRHWVDVLCLFLPPLWGSGWVRPWRRNLRPVSVAAIWLCSAAWYGPHRGHQGGWLPGGRPPLDPLMRPPHLAGHQMSLSPPQMRSWSSCCGSGL